MNHYRTLNGHSLSIKAAAKRPGWRVTKAATALGASIALLAGAGCSSSPSAGATATKIAPTTAAATATAAAASTAATSTSTTPATSMAETTTAAVAANTVAPAWTNADAKPYTGISVTDGVALLYAIDKRGQLLLEAISATGKTMWSQAATRSLTCHCLPAKPPMVYNGHVIYFKQAKTGDVISAQMVAADPLTGNDIATSTAAPFGEWPFECAGGKVCTTQRWADGNTQSLVTFDPASGALSPIGPSQPAGSAVVWGGNEGVFTVSSRGKPDEYFEFIVGGQSKWRKPLTTYFPAGFSTRLHWNFAYDATSKTVFGATFPDLEIDGGSGANLDGAELAKGVTVGISAADGHMVWKVDGEPCEFGQNTEDVCTYSGWNDAGHLPLKGADTRMARIDPASGKPIWTLDLPKSWVGNVRGSGDIYFTSADGATINTATKVIDPLTGAVRPIKDGEHFVCATDIYIDFDPNHLPSQTGYGRGGRTTFFCNRMAFPMVDDAAPKELLKAGTAFGSLTLFVRGTEVVAYPM